MKIKSILVMIMLVVLLTTFAGVQDAEAGSIPGGGQFGFGARMDSALATPQTTSSLALAMAAQYKMNWIALDLDWAAVAPQAETAADLTGLSSLITEAHKQKMDILLSIHNPPAWAVTANGPAPEHVQALLNQVSLVTANRVLVVELFPGANTSKAWGGPANPSAYLSLLQAARDALRANQQIGLVIPSLTPLAQVNNPGDVSAEQFLSSLYQLAPNENFQVVGLHFEQITGAPSDNLQPGSGAVLRQYEMIRQVMLDNGRSSDQVWITAFAWPSTLTDKMEQAAWVEAAYRQLQGQIYIKAAFFNALFLGVNSNPDSTNYAALLEPSLKSHPALALIGSLAAQSAAPSSAVNPASTQNDGSAHLIQASPLTRLWEFIRSLFGLK